MHWPQRGHLASPRMHRLFGGNWHWHPRSLNLVLLLCLLTDTAEGFSRHNQIRYRYFFFLSTATPAEYGSSWATGWIGAAVASPHHSHSNTKSEPHLRPTPQLVAMPDPSPIERGQGWNHILTDTMSVSWPTEAQGELLTPVFNLKPMTCFWTRNWIPPETSTSLNQTEIAM